MQFQKMIAVLITAVLSLSASNVAQGLTVQAGRVRVETGQNGEMYINTPKRRIYVPPNNDYDDGYDDYEDDYYDDDYYCSGQSAVRQEHVQRSSVGRHESYSRISTSHCR